MCNIFFFLDSGRDMPLTTAETIILVYFKKGYTKEVKKDIHLVPLCRELNIKNIKSTHPTLKPAPTHVLVSNGGLARTIIKCIVKLTSVLLNPVFL